MKKLVLILMVVTGAAISSAGSVVASWTANPQNPNSTLYNVYRASGPCGTAGQVFVKLNPIALNVLTYTDTAIINGDTYCYYSTALRNTLESVPSPKAQAAIPMGAPVDFTVTVNIAVVVKKNGVEVAQGNNSVTVPVTVGQE